MKKLSLFFTFLAFCAFPAAVSAYFGKTNEGRSSFVWISNLQSARSASLEGAGAALASDDLGVAIMNPAALHSEQKYQVGVAWQNGDLVNRQALVQFSHPLYNGRLLHSYGFVDNGEIKGYNEEGYATGTSHYPLAQMYAASFAQGFTLFEIGITGRILWERLSQSSDAQTGVAGAVDWGLLWKSPSPRYGAAFVVRNLGWQLRPFIENGTTDYPLSANLALSGFLRPTSLPRLVILGELDAPRYAPLIAKLGGEYTIGHSLFVRTGIQRNVIDITRQVQALFRSETAPDETGTHRLFSLGAGYAARWLTVDYSYSHLFEGMGGEHRLGLRSGF